jgi:small conductance mechanosensitive channel
MIENQYNRGDVVSIGGVTGTVEDVSLRRTSLRDVDGTVHTVPHGLIEVTSNLTRNWSNINLDIPVSYDLDIRAVIDAINDVGDTLAADPDWKDWVIEPPKVARIEALKETGLVSRSSARSRRDHRAAAAGGPPAHPSSWAEALCRLAAQPKSPRRRHLRTITGGSRA